MRRFRIAALALASLFAANTASAQVLLSDNFDGLNGGNSALNYTGFANWTVTGVVDLVTSGFFGVVCAGSAGSCVDLDGSRSTAGSLLSGVFFFSPGETITLSFDVSGNQRGGADDFFFTRVLFGGVTNTSAYSMAGILGSSSGSGAFPSTFTINSAPMAPGTPFTASGFSFTAVNAGQVQFELGTFSADNVGPVLDNVVISKSVPQNVVPEPSTYLLMAAGLAAMGVVARRRRRA